MLQLLRVATNGSTYGDAERGQSWTLDCFSFGWMRIEEAAMASTVPLTQGNEAFAALACTATTF